MIVSDSVGASQHRKRKKERSFIQKQKRFAKQGSYGRGTPLPADMHEYFMNIMKAMNTVKEDEEEMRILASNTFNEIKGKEAEYCCNQIVSRIVENLLPFFPNEQFSEFLENFGDNLRPLFCDSFGSHVLQQTLIVAFFKYKSLENDTENKLGIRFVAYILKVSNFLINNLEEFMWNTYSNAVARTVFNVLSGNPIKNEIKLSLDFQEKSEVTVPSEFKLLIRNSVKRILLWPQFNELCNKPVTSGLLQNLLLASKKYEECLELIEKIMNVYEMNALDLTIEENNPFAKLLEVVLSVSDTDKYKKIYKLVFKKNLIDLATSKTGNFMVQKLIVNCTSEKIFSKIFAKLESKMEDILTAEYSGVLLAIVKGCRRLGLLQGECINMLVKALQAKETKALIPSLCSLKPMESSQAEIQIITLHGCLVIQELLKFKKPISVVNSLLELSESDLAKLLSDMKGSHITDAFVSSPTVGVKSRDRLFKKLKGHYLALAKSKFGSRSLDALWSVINIQQKAMLAEELKANQSELCSDVYGKGFARKIYLDNFRRNRDEWMKIQKTTEATEKYFADIIPPAKKKKKH